jgi:8-oxo-dGTP pyrophosphatase MutT (NUDIX family)
MLIDKGDFHASALILGPDDTTVLIKETRQPRPLWKFPGGKQKRIKPFGKKPRDEYPIETLIREVHEETELWIKKRHTKYIHTIDMGTYRRHFFLSHISSWRGLVALSEEYEEPKIFSLDDLLWLPDFHSDYRTVYLEHMRPGIIPP